MSEIWMPEEWKVAENSFIRNFPKPPEEFQQYLDRYYASNPYFRKGWGDHVKLLPHVSWAEDSTGSIFPTVRLGVGGPASKDLYNTDSHFTFRQFPHCCALYQMYNFSFNALAQNAAYFKAVMDHAISSLLHNTMYFSSGRLQVAMVERRTGTQCLDINGKAYTSIEELYSEGPARGISPVTTPQMEYQVLYNYLMGQKAVREQLMFNRNTGNVIHMMEVLFDYEADDSDD